MAGLSEGWGAEKDVPADDPHWTWSVCPPWIKPQSWEPGCPCTATASVVHMRRGFPFGWKILKSPGILQASWCWGAYFPSPSLESPTCRWPRHDWFGGLPGICLGWRSEERWGRNIETSLQVSVLAHSRPIYNPRKRLPLSFLPSKPEWDIQKCCCLMAVHVTTAVKLVFRGASNSQGPSVCKWLLPSRNNLEVGNLIMNLKSGKLSSHQFQQVHCVHIL